jgi:hypothetical protein
MNQAGFTEWNGHLVPDTCTFEQLPLSILNAHPRDVQIVFDDEPHKYYINGATDYTSVTTVIHSMFGEFDSIGTAKKMVAKPTFLNGEKQYKQYRNLLYNNGVARTPGELVLALLERWDHVRDEAAMLGTKLHRDCELFYNDMSVDNDTREYKFFLQYVQDQEDKKFQPHRTEIMVFGEEEKICGSVDMLYIDEDGNGRLRDWKRSKKISKYGFGKKGKGKLAHLSDCNFMHYSLQLNLYRYFLEKYYGFNIVDMAIVVFHPKNKAYQEIFIEKMDDEIADLIAAHTGKHRSMFVKPTTTLPSQFRQGQQEKKEPMSELPDQFLCGAPNPKKRKVGYSQLPAQFFCRTTNPKKHKSILPRSRENKPHVGCLPPQFLASPIIIAET